MEGPIPLASGSPSPEPPVRRRGVFRKTIRGARWLLGGWFRLGWREVDPPRGRVDRRSGTCVAFGYCPPGSGFLSTRIALWISAPRRSPRA